MKGEYVTATVLCREIGISKSTLRRYALAGVMPFKLRKTASGGYKKVYSLNKGRAVFLEPTIGIRV